MQTEVVLMVGESGSGKSHLAHQMVEDKGGRAFKRMRLNRDDLRRMIHGGTINSREMELLVLRVEESAARLGLSSGFSVIVDNTHLNSNTRRRWQELAKDAGVPYREVRMDTPLEQCVSRDYHRAGMSRVGVPVIHRQFLESGRLPIDKEKPIVIVDVDGTLAHNDGHRSFFDESKVLLDKPVGTVVKWVRSLYIDHTIFVVSGRHSSCGNDTVAWLRAHEIPFHFIAMRHAWDNRDDCIVKQEILNSLLKLVPKEQIKMVLDDRPKVVRMWRENGLKVIPVAGACKEF